MISQQGGCRIVLGHSSQDAPGAGSIGLNELTWLQVLLTNVAYEIFTEEIIPQPFMDEPGAVFSQFMPMAPVVRLTRLPLSTGKQQRGNFILDLQYFIFAIRTAAESSLA